MQESVSSIESSNTEFLIRTSVFVCLIVTFAVAEWLWPRRKRYYTRLRRWSANFGIFLLDIVVTTGMQSIAGVAAAYYAQQHNIGLFNYFDTTATIAFIGTIILLDLAVYGQHVAFHKIPFLWRMHKVHHADPELDVSSALRFHPLEIGLSVIIKSAVVIIIGADPAAAVVFAVILNGGAMFNHSNLRLPAQLDKVLRLFIITPDVHRIHHSNWHTETDSNYGFNLSLWDRIFGTMRQQPRDGHDDMTLGLDDCNAEHSTRLWSILVLPFKSMRKKKNSSSADTQE